MSAWKEREAIYEKGIARIRKIADRPDLGREEKLQQIRAELQSLNCRIQICNETVGRDNAALLYSVNAQYGIMGVPEIKGRKRLYVMAGSDREAAELTIRYLTKKKNACDIQIEEPYVLPVINDGV